MARRRRRTYLKWYSAATAVGLLIIVGFNLAVDPLHFYHRPFLHSTFVRNQRYQNPGLAKNYDYDAVVIGTSHTENFSTDQMAKVLGWKVMRLSMSGSTAYEQQMILKKALDTGKVKHVLWGLDFDSFLRKPDDVAVGKANFPFYLYNESPLTPIQYLLSRDTFGFSWQALWGRGEHRLERLNTWSDQFEFSEARALAAWRYEQNSGHRSSPTASIVLDSTPAEALAANVRLHVAQLIEAHPEVTFHLFFPPFSILAYADDFTLSEDRFSARLAFKETVVNSICGYANARLSDFETAFDLTHDLNNYKDLTHYHRKVNDFIVESIARDDWAINRENYRQKIRDFETNVHAFVRQALPADSQWHEKLGLAGTPLFFHDPEAPTANERPQRVATEPDRNQRL